MGALSTGQHPQRRETAGQEAWRVEQLLARWKAQGIEPPEEREPVPIAERKNRDLSSRQAAA